MNRNIIDFTLLSILILVIYMRNVTLVSFFNTILGRLVLILFIVALSLRDTLWGLLGLLLLIVFRESYVEGFENIQVQQTSSSTSLSNDNLDLEPLIDPKDVPPNGTVSIKDVRNTTFTETISKMLSKPKDVTPYEWRKENCSKDNKPMQNNNVITNYKEIPNLFSNFSFLDQDCNPCDISCNFKITSAKDAVAVSEKVRSQPSNQTIVGPSRDGNASQTIIPAVIKPSDGTTAGSGAVVPPTPLPVSDTSKTTPANVPGTQPQTDLNKLKQACDYKDSSKCIFDGYVKQGDSCVLQGSSQSYNAPALANYDTNTFVNWLQGLFNRNQPGTNADNSEANEVYNYWNKCKMTPGNEYLNQLNLTKPSSPANNMQSLPDCIVNNITIPGWKKLPDGTCIAPAGQKCCNASTYQGQPACSANFSGYDSYWTNQWISSCIQK